ncbi:hypothetical protein [Asinibacterium sp. OR53]|jgi:hypothetical protein|uniref:hypothetical protein n=1 Tax=Asinibacterium sp. OR53 TaxID=925409 RepID=UPI00042A903E|nr:hypothetical protein [Asinibacterium sp. OR53]
METTEIKAKIIEGNRLALKKLVEKKKKEGSFLLVSEKGKVVKVNAKDIKL